MSARLLAALFLTSVCTAQVQPAKSLLPEGYAGAEQCGLCHQDIAMGFFESPHQLLRKVRGGRWAGRECEACHGPGKRHMETYDAKQIFRFQPDDVQGVNARCLECHGNEETHGGRLFNAHDRNSLNCLACHSVHSSTRERLLKAEPNDLCSSCHISERAAFNRPFRHKLQEKAIACIDCHDQHGSPPPAQVRRVFANEMPCLKCHADKRGPFPFEHAAVKLQPCTVCHEPHGSANPRMLVRHDVPQLCLECHTLSSRTLGGPPPAFHDLRTSRFQNCTVCHSKIHGSFISRDFLR